MSLDVAALALLAAACGSSGTTSFKDPSPSISAAISSVAATSPTLSVSPRTRLVGGQQLHVSLTGFPQHATVAVYECVGTSRAASGLGCGAAASIILYAASTGSAMGTFAAQPAASTGPNGTRTPCHQQCALVAVVIKLGPAAPPSPPPLAIAPLSFSTTTATGLADVSLEDLSWISPRDGWALAAQPCITGTCARLAHTSDDGANWQALPDPPAHLLDRTGECFTVVCVSKVRFASPTVGYLYGPALLMTTNGGSSWRAQPGPQVETLTVAGSNVYRVAYDHVGCPGPCQPTLQEAVIGSTAWHRVIGQLAYPDRSGNAQIVASGPSLLVAMYGSWAGPASGQAILYRSNDGSSSWHPIPDPCAGRGSGGKGQEEDLIDLAGAPGGFFAGLCSPHTGFATFVVTSTDAGGSWQRAGALPKLQGLALLAAASRSTFVVSTGATTGAGPFTARLLVSVDAGVRWTTTATDTQQLTQAGSPAWLGFESLYVGRWISGPHSVWTTVDGGLHWRRTAFG